MRTLGYSFYFLLALLSTLLLSILATPNLGIERDYGSQFNFGDENSLHSYSAIIEFEDKSIPGDSTKMSDAQFVNLVHVAYKEMLARWSDAKLFRSAAPGAMIAMESEGFIFFASSIKSLNKVEYNKVDAGQEGSVGWYDKECQRTSNQGHRNGGGCGEPNVLRLYGDNYMARRKLGNPQPQQPYRPPPITKTSPRVAAWTRFPNENPRTAVGRNMAPCSSGDKGYGCAQLVVTYGMKAISNVVPDERGQDAWKFKIEPDPRRQEC